MTKKDFKKYGISPIGVQKVDLRHVYAQQTPNRDCRAFYANGKLNWNMSQSPHVDIFNLIQKYGEKWVRKNYKKTRYAQMLRELGRKDIPDRIFESLKSMKKGYLRGKHSSDYIVVLNKTFAVSRYCRDVPNLAPEIFSGHHRAGALISLKQYEVEIVLAEDILPKTKFTNGKIHLACME